MSGAQPDRRPIRSQAQSAYTELRRRIFDNELSPGTQLLEQELAIMLGMSRTPVREAMLRLSHEGLVEVRPRHGMRVLPVSVEDMREIYEILASLEATAVELAVRRGPTTSDLTALDGAVAAMQVALAADDLDGWAAADAQFHRLLADLSGNQRLRGLVAMFHEQTHRVRLATLRLRPRPLRSTRDHAALVAAIRNGDAAEASDLHRRHRLGMMNVLLDLLRVHRLQQF